MQLSELTQRLALLQGIDVLHKELNSEWIPVSAGFKSEQHNLEALALAGFIDRVVIDPDIGLEVRITNKGYQLIDLLFDVEKPEFHANAEAVKRVKARP